jgi:hypothetical protein
LSFEAFIAQVFIAQVFIAQVFVVGGLSTSLNVE